MSKDIQTLYPIKFYVHKNIVDSKPGESLILPQIWNPKSYHKSLAIKQTVELSNHHQSHKVIEIHQMLECGKIYINPISIKMLNPTKVPSVELSQQESHEGQIDQSNY